MEKKANATMTQYVADFACKAERLEEAGITISDELLSIMLLSSLPAEYDNFSVAIETRDEIPKFENLKIKLIEEEARQNDRSAKTTESEKSCNALVSKDQSSGDKKSNGSAKNDNKKKFQGKCFKCKKKGHMSKDCKSKKDESKNVGDAMTAIACNTGIIEKSNSWLLDSGASRHMCNVEQRFENLNVDEQFKIFTAADQSINSLGCGDVKINAKINGNSTNLVQLKDALHVPNLRNNLLSVSSITDHGYTVTFRQNDAIVNRQDGSVALKAIKRNNLYVVDQLDGHATFLCENSDDNLIRWHQRYGHLNVNDLKRMNNNGIVVGLNLNSKLQEINCEICNKSKIHVQPFKTSENRESEVLGLVHSDICSPTKTESLGGAKYFVTFIDDYSRYTEICSVA